jgi:ferric-dicitrate binding protein FerR (iron transport regulator)
MTANKFETEDWPDDPANAELLQLAQQLPEAAPPLPADALARVRGQMQAELDRTQRRQRRRRFALGIGMAAAILLAIVGYFTNYQPTDSSSVPQIAPPSIEDRIVVAVGDAGNAGGKPLIPLDEYRSLFAD